MQKDQFNWGATQLFFMNYMHSVRDFGEPKTCINTLKPFKNIYQEEFPEIL